MPRAPSARPAPRLPAPRFGIGEWYGHSFIHLSEADRRRFAQIALTHTRTTAPPCPFKNADGTEKCTKKGGVCSLRLYSTTDGSTAQVVTDDGGDVRCMCPHRFKQADVVPKAVGLTILGTDTPQVVSEIRFLQRARPAAPAEAAATEEREGDHEEAATEAEPEAEGDLAAKEDVGNIDNVLIHETEHMLFWCALEIQAVYFSGTAMNSLFRHIKDFAGPEMPFPDAVRRPDYRSSGPKRLMPQLQIKVPTLRRWGKKMAVVVDAGFYRSLGTMETVDDLSNSDIAWFVVDYDESTNPISIVIGPPHLQTLERSVEGLTGGFPVSLGDFEAKIREKMGG